MSHPSNPACLHHETDSVASETFAEMNKWAVHNEVDQLRLHSAHLFCALIFLHMQGNREKGWMR